MRDDPMKERDELDSQLDAALATYVDAETNPGLTGRIISVTSGAQNGRAETSHPQRRRPLADWIPLTAAAIAAVLLIAILLLHRASLPARSAPVIARVSSPTPNAVLPVKPSRPAESGALRAIRHEVRHPAPPPLPRREVFPTPIPLTAQEQAFLGNRRLGDVPAQEISAQTVQSVPHGPVEPIHIAAIHIPPLNPPDNGNN
jgi:hypothetical protein